MCKLVFVLLDGLNAETALRHMGGMSALTANGQAFFFPLYCGMPPLSRPLYASLFTGLSPAELGILTNTDSGACPVPTLFHEAKAAGKISAAAAYHWMYELINGEPFDSSQHRIVSNPELPISCGLFYHLDTYPDDFVFTDAEALRLKYHPDILLVHSMGIDDAGHADGSNSRKYRCAARNADIFLATAIPGWLKDGYSVCITSDHGMHPDGCHNDDDPCVRRVPLWLLGAGWEDILHALGRPPLQTDIANMCRTLLKLPSLADS